MADAGVKQKGELKTARIPIKIVPQEALRKPDWIRVKAGNDAGRFGEIKKMLREQKLHTVCEEAACPNIGECFGRGTATFLLMGDTCTRSCGFCKIKTGRPSALDPDEPRRVGESVQAKLLAHPALALNCSSFLGRSIYSSGASHFARAAPGPISMVQSAPAAGWSDCSFCALKKSTSCRLVRFPNSGSSPPRKGATISSIAASGKKASWVCNTTNCFPSC